jgi:hypothetical protein
VVALVVAEPLDTWTTSAPTEEDKSSREIVRNLTELKLDGRIAALPHLKDLDLSHAAKNMTPAAYRGIKEVMYLRCRKYPRRSRRRSTSAISA